MHWRHRLRTPNETFFHWNRELLGLGRQIGQINSGAFGVFSAKLWAPILVQWVPYPCFPLFNYYFYKKLSLYMHIPNIYLELGFEFGPKRIRDLSFVCLAEYSMAILDLLLRVGINANEKHSFLKKFGFKGGFFSESEIRFSNLPISQKNYSKKLSWAWNLNILFTNMGRYFKFQDQDSFFGIFIFGRLGDLKNESHFLKKRHL